VTITALIADDEEVPRAQLLAALREAWPALRVVAEAANGLDAWDAYLEREPRLCFLDVRMPGLTGIEVAQRIAARSHIVFVAAAGDPSMAAFDAAGVHHLAKPIDPARLVQAVAQWQASLDAGATDLRGPLDRLAGQLRRPAYADVIEAGVGGEASTIRLQDVIFFEAGPRFTRVVHDRGEATLRTPLKELVGCLDPDTFWQIHRGVIVNRHRVESARRVDEGSMVLTLRGRGETLPVSQHFQRLFTAA